MIRALAIVASLLSGVPAWTTLASAGDIAVEDEAMRAPIPPDVPGGAKPVLRECKVTTARSQGADGAEIERTHRTCRWAVAPGEP